MYICENVQQFLSLFLYFVLASSVINATAIVSALMINATVLSVNVNNSVVIISPDMNNATLTIPSNVEDIFITSLNGINVVVVVFDLTNIVIFALDNATGGEFNITVICTMHNDSMADRCEVMATGDNGEGINGNMQIRTYVY